MSSPSSANNNLQHLYETGCEAIFIFDKGVCIGQNATAEKIFGYTSKEAIGRLGIDWIVEKHHSKVIDKIQTNDQRPYDVEAIKKDGTILPVEVRGKLIEHENKILRITSVLDISDRKKAEEKAYRGELVLDTIFDTLPDLFFLIDPDGTIRDYRAKKSESLYVPPDVFLGKRMQDVLPKNVSEKFVKNIQIALSQKQLASFEYFLYLEGKQVYFEARVSPIQKSQQMVIIARDITEKRLAENEILKSEIKFRSIFEASVVSIIVTDYRQEIIEWNSGSEYLFGYSTEEAKGMNLSKLIPERLMHQHKLGFNHAVKSNGLSRPGINHEVYGLKKNGEEFPITLTLGSWVQNGEIFFSATILDITERKEAEEEILYQAHFDSLTALPNRFLALDRLNQLLNEAKRCNELVAVLFLDLDDFKKVNDSLGHEIGDKLLVDAAQRLSSVVRSGDTVGRLGGDEFILLLPGLKNASDARPTVEKLLAKFRDSFKIENRELILTLSVGVAVYPQDGICGSDLLRNADSAMYHAKNAGRNTYSYYQDSMNEEVARRLMLEEQIHGALERNEFEVFYQALRDVKTDRIIGAEALLRWNNEKLGNVSPAEFIPIIEQSGMINPIGMFVLDSAMSQLSQWNEAYNLELKIAVNLSPRQFRDPKLVDKISALVDKYHFSSGNLELEITEGVLMGGHTSISESLQSLEDIGVHIAMDDFGTGYSSMSNLRKYPFNMLKIDRSFVRDLMTNSADKELINATIVMSHALGLKVVAEGVETIEQLAALKKLGCDLVQGFLFGRPVNAKEFSSQIEADLSGEQFK